MIQLRPEIYALLIGVASLCGAAFVLACLRYRKTKSVSEITRLAAICLILGVVATAPERTMKSLLFALPLMWTGDAWQFWRERRGKSSSTQRPTSLTP